MMKSLNRGDKSSFFQPENDESKDIPFTIPYDLKNRDMIRNNSPGKRSN